MELILFQDLNREAKNETQHVSYIHIVKIVLCIVVVIVFIFDNEYIHTFVWKIQIK